MYCLLFYQNWVVTKYQRLVPVMNVRSKDKKKIIRYDPSKYCHQIKRLDITTAADKKQAITTSNQVTVTYILDYYCKPGNCYILSRLLL